MYGRAYTRRRRARDIRRAAERAQGDQQGQESTASVQRAPRES